jgi:hypothetical protein
VREEQVAAPSEAWIDAHPEALADVGVEAERLLDEQAVRRRSPLLPDAAGLQAGRSGADPGPIEDSDGRPAFPEVERDRQPHDSRTDDDHIRARAHTSELRLARRVRLRGAAEASR